jgi:HK97 family phage major capsid protein
MNLQLQRERRNALVTEAKNLNETVTGAAWTKEIGAKYDGFMDEIGQIDDAILRDKEILDASAESSLSDMLKKSGGKEVEIVRDSLGKRFMRNGYEGFSAEDFKQVRNTMSVGGAAAEGGYTVQTEVVKSVLNALKTFGGMRAVATNLQTEQGNPLSYPTSDGTNEVGEIIAENSTATSSDPSFGTLPLNVYKFGSKIITVPFELLQDSAVDIESFINDRIVTRLGRLGNLVFTTGTGTGQPTGIVTASTAGVTAATGGTVTVTYDNLVDLQHSIDPAYRDGAFFMMHDSTIKAIRKLKDSNGRPLWVPDFDGGITAAQGGTLLGSPVMLNQQMPVMAANAKSILFGNFKNYIIRDVMAMNLFRFTDSVYASKGQVGFLAWMRSGGNFIDNGGSVKAFVNSST